MIADLTMDAVKHAFLKVSDTNGIMYSKPKVIETYSTVHTSFVIDNADILLNDTMKKYYVFRKVANAGGMTPLLAKDGKPVISPIVNNLL